jgi:uncharacterized protein YecE (DUF72 family)
MDFGKVNHPDRIRFELPPLEKRSTDFLSSLSRDRGEGTHSFAWIGCPVWGRKEWIGKVYPDGTSSRDFLKYYSQQFNSVELNTTFYRIPDSETVQSWRKTVPSSFRFCPKVFQGISHQSSLVSAQAWTHSFCNAALQFEENLGVSFLQLPQDFDVSQLGVLVRWFQYLPKNFRLAVEFRHSSWFENQSLRPRVFDALASRGIGTVITDTAGRRDVLHGSVTSSFSFVRFLGNQLHPSDYLRIEDWIDRIGEWKEAGLKELYFFMHQPDDADAPELISDLIQKLNRKYGWALPNWKPVDSSPAQYSLFG